MKQESLSFGRRYDADTAFRESLLAMSDAITLTLTGMPTVIEFP